MKPAGPIRSSNSAGWAGRNSALSAFRSLMSLTRWSPRRITSLSSSSPVMTGYAFSSAPAGTPNSLATAATVVIPGVSTSSGASSGGGSSTGWASALAISTFAA